MREGPDHYTRLKPEPIDVIRAWDLPWCPANALKYIARYRNKGGVEDLKKARHYLDLEIEAMSPPRCTATHYMTGARCERDVQHSGSCIFGSERPEPEPPKDRG